MNGVEIELKLATEAAMLARVARLKAVAAHKQGRARTEMLNATYYDTPDLALWRAGITVRLRSEGGRIVQTVKSAGSRTAGLFSRREWECPSPTGELHRPHLTATELPPLCRSKTLDALGAVFTTHIRRTIHILKGPDWEVELAIDSGTVQAGDRVMPLAEIELELKAGSPDHLYGLAEAIATALPCRVPTRAKSDHGFQLALGEDIRPTKAPPLALDPDMSVAQAFQAIARNCLYHLLASEACLPGPHGSEAVHQMRVALRRLRSALKVFRAVVTDDELGPLRDEIAWLLSHLGPARDADVFLAGIVAPVMADHPDTPALLALCQDWTSERDTAFATARAAAADRRFALLALRLGRWIDHGAWTTGDLGRAPLTPFARRVLRRLRRRLLDAGGARLGDLPTAELHGVRILGKQMRYGGEFFASLYPKSTSRTFLALLAQLQDQLGLLNDLAVAVPRLAARHHRADWAWASGLIAGWHEARRPEIMKEAEQAWRQLRKCPPFWKED